ncbi:Importin-5 [Quillaja saponaria]|uniref:Importin-5 n=1 Tax=Quillaja saponaria TaxID=32244 RepID=A0AAD7PZB7_QUISA|nr:Importin-5 [Quillaja saponaria]
MEVLMSLQRSELEIDDPTTTYMLQALARLCKCLGQDFLPYLTIVMPPLLQSTQLKPHVIITFADSDADIDEDDDSIETATLGDKGWGSKLACWRKKLQIATCFAAMLMS